MDELSYYLVNFRKRHAHFSVWQRFSLGVRTVECAIDSESNGVIEPSA